MRAKRGSLRRAVECLESRRLLAADLISHWVADDLAGEESVASWVDRVAGLEVRASGTPVVVANRFGGRSALRFDPRDGDDFFRLNPNRNPLPAGEFSVVVAFAVSGPVAGETGEWFTNTGLVDANTLGFGNDWGMSIAPGGQISVGAGTGFGSPPTTLYSEDRSLNDGKLHTVIFSRQGSMLSIYVDDHLSSRRNDASASPRIQRDVTFGILQNLRNPLDGEIAEVRFYDGALSDAEARAEYDAISAFYNNTPPVGNDDTYAVAEDSPLFFAPVATGVLANDIDADGDLLTVELVSTTQNGILSLNDDGSFIYSPERDFFGVDSFTYRARDFRASNIVTVRLDVENVYDAAIGVTDSYKLLPSESLRVGADSGLLSNDVNPDRGELTAELVDVPNAGQLVLRSDGSFDYEANGFAGQTSFRYRINDNVTVSAPIEVILLVNTPPQAASDVFETLEDETLRVVSSESVLRNDVDAENDMLSVFLMRPPIHGSFAIEPDGSFVYEPNRNFYGEDSLLYQVNDGIDASPVVEATIRVRAVNDAPAANNDVYFTSMGRALSVRLVDGLLANDSDIENGELSVQLVSQPENGKLDVSPSGAFVYRPNARFQGIDSFTYSAFDGDLTSAGATVEIYVGTSPVRISEFMAGNIDLLETSVRSAMEEDFPRDKLTPDWIEIENVSGTDFDLDGFYLSDNGNNRMQWRIPSGTIVPGGGRLLIFASGKDLRDVELDEKVTLHTNFSLNLRGEELILAFPDGGIADRFEPLLQYPNISYGIALNGERGYLTEPTPGRSNSPRFDGVVEPIQFSVGRGVYEQPFSLELTTGTRDAQIRFTTDGTEPGRESGTVYDRPINVSTTSTIRAAAFVDGRIPSEIQTHTFLFLKDVIQQPEQPDGYPERWAGLPASYGMDPDVVGESNLFDDLYRKTIIEDLQSLPTLSLVFDPDNLFASDGIYQNPKRTGDAWERSTSVEFFDPSGAEEGFQLNSGVRVMGGSSREPDIPKHSLRLEFREKFGWGSLNYPLFEDSPFGEDAAKTFDELVLRVGFNNSWMHRHYYQSLRGEQPRDQWVRDLQFAMGQPSARGRFVHVYLNGMYWGIYNLQERPAAPHMEQYFGGDKDTQWDVINSGQAIDGSVRAWSQLHRDARNVGDPEQYEQIQKQVDVVNLADYMLLNFYVGNTDWDGHNWIAAARKDGPFRFFAWDSEFAISLPPSNAAVGDNAERQIINVNKTNQNSANNPSGLHRLLLRNDEYRMMFADRVQKHMFNAGVLTPEIATDLFLARSLEIDRAVVAESARWGDFRRDVNPGRWRSDQFDLYTRDEHFLAQKDFIVSRYLPVRTQIVVDQLRRGNVYPDVDAPVFSQHGGRVPKGFPLTLVEAEDAQTFYTLDGSDPRIAGGGINSNASRYRAAIVLTENVTVKARTIKDGEWSALSEATFRASVPASPESLRISEVHYHPSDSSEAEIAAGFADADEFEFVELINISNDSIDLSDVQFVRAEVDGETEGIDFRFGTGAVNSLEPNQRVVVVENLDAFRLRYGEGVLVAGQWIGGLSNSRERLTLMAGESTIHEFTYRDDWYPSTDGRGSSLESIDPASKDLSSWNQQSGWRSSLSFGGSPGGVDRLPGDVNGDGVFDSTDLLRVFQYGEYEDDEEDNSTFDEGDWNGDGDFNTRDLVLVFQLGVYQQEAIPLFARTSDAKVPTVRNDALHAHHIDQLLGEMESFGKEESLEWVMGGM